MVRKYIQFTSQEKLVEKGAKWYANTEQNNRKRTTEDVKYFLDKRLVGYTGINV